MEKEDKYVNEFENKAPSNEAEMKKARLVSSIVNWAEQGEEEENMGRS